MRLFYPYFFSPFHIKLFRDIVIISCLAIVKSNIFIIGQSYASFLSLSHRMVYIIPALVVYNAHRDQFAEYTTFILRNGSY